MAEPPAAKAKVLLIGMQVPPTTAGATPKTLPKFCRRGQASKRGLMPFAERRGRPAPMPKNGSRRAAPLAKRTPWWRNVMAELALLRIKALNRVTVVSRNRR